jgi:hypothetical protein
MPRGEPVYREALGAKLAETLTPEFYQEQKGDQRLEQSQG